VRQTDQQRPRLPGGKIFDLTKRVLGDSREKTKASRDKEVPFSNQVFKNCSSKEKRGKIGSVFDIPRLKNEPMVLQKASDRALRNYFGVSDLGFMI